MSDGYIYLYGAIAAMVGALIPALVSYLGNRGRNRAEEIKTAAETWRDLHLAHKVETDEKIFVLRKEIKALQSAVNEIPKMQTRISFLESTLDLFHSRAYINYKQMIAEGVTPLHVIPPALNLDDVDGDPKS